MPSVLKPQSPSLASADPQPWKLGPNSDLRPLLLRSHSTTNWQAIDKEWEQTKDALRKVAERNGVAAVQVRAIGQGTGPLERVTDALVKAEAFDRDFADKIVGLSKRWQWMRRTTVPQEQFLDEAVVENFKRDAIFIREQLSKSARVISTASPGGRKTREPRPVYGGDSRLHMLVSSVSPNEPSLAEVRWIFLLSLSLIGGAAPPNFIHINLSISRGHG